MQNTKSGSKTISKKRYSTVLSWIVAVIFILTGLVTMVGNFFVGLIALVTGIIFIPLVSVKIADRVKRLGLIKGILIVVVLIALVAISPESSTTQTEPGLDHSQSNDSSIVVNEEEVDMETSEAGSVEATTEPDVMTRLWIAVDEAFGTRKNYDVEWLDYDPVDTVAIVIKSPDDYWDDDAVVREAYSMLVKYGKEVFDNPEVVSIGVVVQGNFVDSYGNEIVKEAVRIIMPKTEFQKFDWENLKYMPVSSQIQGSSEIYMIHPSIRQNLDPDDLYLSN